MKREKFIITCILVFLIGLSGSISTSAYELWSKGLYETPSQIYCSTNLSTAQRSRAIDAMTTWNTGCFTFDCLDYNGFTTATAFPDQDSMNLITGTATSESYLAKCTVVQKHYTLLWLDWYAVEYDINVNPAYTWYTGTSSSIPSTSYDFQSATLHELGHALGLDDTASQYITVNGQQQRIVMYSYLDDGLLARVLSQDDKQGVAYLY